MQHTKISAGKALPVRREGIIRWHALPGQGTRRLICLILALGLLLESAQAQLQPPPFRWASRAGSAGSEDLRDMAVDPAGNSVIVGNLNPGSPTTFGTITVNLAVSSIGVTSPSMIRAAMLFGWERSKARLSRGRIESRWMLLEMFTF